MARSETVRFKGTRQGVHLLIEPDATLPEILLELDQRLKGADQFFRSASVMLNVGSRELGESDLGALQEVLDRYGLVIISARASQTDTRALFRSKGVSLDAPDAADIFAGLAKPESNGDSPARSDRGATLVSDDAIVVHRNLRSGQSISHSGDLCLIGDVNPGAEIVAGDNVIVWGSLRGVVQAGMKGNDSAVICALELAPTQLRIASLVTRQPETGELEPVPEMARIVDGQIIVEQWLPRSRRARKK